MTLAEIREKNPNLSLVGYGERGFGEEPSLVFGLHGGAVVSVYEGNDKLSSDGSNWQYVLTDVTDQRMEDIGTSPDDLFWAYMDGGMEMKYLFQPTCEWDVCEIMAKHPDCKFIRDNEVIFVIKDEYVISIYEYDEDRYVDVSNEYAEGIDVGVTADDLLEQGMQYI